MFLAVVEVELRNLPSTNKIIDPRDWRAPVRGIYIIRVRVYIQVSLGSYVHRMHYRVHDYSNNNNGDK